MVSGPAWADESFRCPTDRLVRLGDLLPEARKRCGAPDQVAQRTEKHRIAVRGHDALTGAPLLEEREVEVAIEEWYFDRGSERLVRLLRFENGRLASISTGRYGVGDK